MLYWFIKKVFGPLIRLTFRPWVENEESVPEHGGAILASNHLSFSDSIFLPLVLTRRITFPAKMEYFTEGGLKGWAKRLFFSGTGQIPVDRSGGEASRAALEAGLAVLRRGELFGIYPEGTRSPDGRLYKGKTGIARMALEAKVPVVPVAMIDTDKAQPTGQAIPNLVRIGVRFGPRLDFSRYQGMEHDHDVLRAITDEIMYELMKLSGQEYVDEYATKRKDALAAKAEALLAETQAAAVAAAARAEELVASARAETQAAAAKAEELVKTARVETSAAVAKAKAETQELADQWAARAKAETQAATAKAEGFVDAAKARIASVKKDTDEDSLDREEHTVQDEAGVEAEVVEAEEEMVAEGSPVGGDGVAARDEQEQAERVAQAQAAQSAGH